MLYRVVFALLVTVGLSQAGVVRHAAKDTEKVVVHAAKDGFHAVKALVKLAF